MLFVVCVPSAAQHTAPSHHRRCCYSLCIQFYYYYYYCSSFVFLHYSITRKTLFPLACDVLAVIGIYSGVFIYLFIFIYLAVSASNRNFGFCLLSSTSSVAVSIHALTHFVREKFSLIKIMWQLSIVDFILVSQIHFYLDSINVCLIMMKTTNMPMLGGLSFGDFTKWFCKNHLINANMFGAFIFL